MSGRALRVALICSLALNLFVIGGLAGAALMWKRVEAQRPLAGMGRPQRLRQAAMSLSPPYRRALRRAVAQTVRELRPQVEQARAARRESARLITQPQLDRSALDAALASARAADGVIRARLEASVVAFAATLPAEERASFAAALAMQGQMPRPRDGVRAQAR